MTRGKTPTTTPREVTFGEWLADPKRYVRRGEIVSVVSRLIELHERSRKPWYRKLWGKIKAFLDRNRTPPTGGADAEAET